MKIVKYGFCLCLESSPSAVHEAKEIHTLQFEIKCSLILNVKRSATECHC